MKIFDRNGNERSWTWLIEEFGDVQIHKSASTSAFRVDRLVEVVGPTSLTVTLLAENSGQVAFSWPDATPVQGSEWFDRAETGNVNPDGAVGFGMGQGAYYDPKVQGGPHSVWVWSNHSDIVTGLGMVAGTNHRHLDVAFEWKNAEPEEPGESRCVILQGQTFPYLASQMNQLMHAGWEPLAGSFAVDQGVFYHVMVRP